VASSCGGWAGLSFTGCGLPDRFGWADERLLWADAQAQRRITVRDKHSSRLMMLACLYLAAVFPIATDWLHGLVLGISWLWRSLA
jgi:hypothetical protein